MKSINRIVACTDLSAPSRYAVDRGYLLAEQTGAHLSIAHALNLTPFHAVQELVGDASPFLADHITQQAQDALESLTPDNSGQTKMTADTQLFIGAADKCLPDYAQKIDAQLIIVGARGAGFLHRLLPGGTAMRLLRLAHIPVLLVKHAPHVPYKKILVPVDFSSSSAHAIALAQLIAPQASLILTHIYDIPYAGRMSIAGVRDDVIKQYREAAYKYALHQLEQLTRETGLSKSQYSIIVRHGDTVQNLLEIEQEKDCDLIVLGKHGQSTMESLLLGSVTKHLLSDSQSDVLVVENSSSTS